MLSNEEIKLYKRQIGMQSWDRETQIRLKSSRVFVAGTGGLGSPVLYYLAAAGIGNLVITDSDSIETSNLNRQILHTHRRIGKTKVDSAFTTLSLLNPYINITPVHKKITGKNVLRITGDADIIIDCLDNFKARQFLNKASVEKNIPMVHAGVSEFQGQMTFLHPPETACLACFISDKRAGQKNYIVGATAGVIGSLQAIEAIKYLTGIGINLKNKILFWDGLTMTFEKISMTRNRKCKVCGHIK